MPTSRKVTTDAPADFRRHPLKEFKADIADISDKPTDNNPNRYIIVFDCANIEVIEANEPFNFPVTQIEVMELNFPKTEWTVLTESIKNCGYSGDINGLIGKRVHWKHMAATLNTRISVATPATDDAPAMPAVYADRQRDAWHIIAIEGVENTTNTLVDKVAELADGKDAAGFKAAFMSDLSLQQYTNYGDIAQQAMNNTLLDFLVQIQKVTFDGTLYHKV